MERSKLENKKMSYNIFLFIYIIPEKGIKQLCFSENNLYFTIKHL